MKSSISLEYLLRFLEQPRRESIIEGVTRRDANIVGPLESVAREAYSFYDDLFEQEGPQALNHYAWLSVEFGNFYLELRLEDKALEAFYEAWKTFANPQARGHDGKAHTLVAEFPKLVEKYPEVAQYYAKLEPNESLLKEFPKLAEVIQLARQYTVSSPIPT